MRLALAVATCGLAGCNLVFGLDPPGLRDAADGDAVAADALEVDAVDAPRQITGITQVVAGGDHTCVVRDEAVRCWGANGNGQLGYGSTQDVGDDEEALAGGDVALGVGIPVQLAAGATHTCALLDSGAVRCWGLGQSGQLGLANTDAIGDDEVPAAVAPVVLAELATTVAAGRAHTCAVLAGGRVRCWGLGVNGALGYGNINNVGDNELVLGVGDVPNIAGVFAVAAGDDHTCVLGANGTVACWGLGADGRLGFASSASIGDNETPDGTAIAIGGPALQIVAGGAHTCALLTSGAVRCWGDDTLGQLGTPGPAADVGDTETPDSVATIELGGTATELAAGRAHTCALRADGTVVCWGLGNHGQLGYGNVNTIGDNEAPAIAGAVPVGGVVQHIAAGGDHTCALLATNQVRCWGAGAAGQLGLANQNDIGDNELPMSTVPIGP